MTLRNTLVPALLFLAACADDTPTNTATGIDPGKEKVITGQPEDRGVPFYGLTQDLNRSSDLAQINTANINNLTPIWTLALGEKIGSTHAIDAATGRRIELLWLRQPRPGLPRRQTVSHEYGQPHNSL